MFTLQRCASAAATSEDHTTGEGGYLTSPLGGVGPGAEVRAYRVSPRSSPAKGRTGDEFGYFNTQAAQEVTPLSLSLPFGIFDGGGLVVGADRGRR